MEDIAKIKEQLEIEKMEKEMLFNLAYSFRNSLDEFSTSFGQSINYLREIAIPLIMASKEDKSYNPFSEIIEKFVMHILIVKLQKDGFTLLPLGYSSDLTLENNKCILNIDIKTANIENTSDFRNTINIGLNQTSHIAKIKYKGSYVLPEPYYVYPNLPPVYEKEGEKKYVLTYGLQFIYPSYRELIKEVRNEYVNLRNFFKEQITKNLNDLSKLKNTPKDVIEELLKSEPDKSKPTKVELISESMFRGYFVHKMERDKIKNSLNLTTATNIVEDFEKKVEKFIEKFNIRPIAIIAISIPNGLLKDKYINKFVSGKDFAKSTRFYYQDGIFELLNERCKERIPRVIFIDYDKNYEEQLKSLFNKIHLLELTTKEL